MNKNKSTQNDGIMVEAEVGSRVAGAEQPQPILVDPSATVEQTSTTASLDDPAVTQERTSDHEEAGGAVNGGQGGGTDGGAGGAGNDGAAAGGDADDWTAVIRVFPTIMSLFIAGLDFYHLVGLSEGGGLQWLYSCLIHFFIIGLSLPFCIGGSNRTVGSNHAGDVPPRKWYNLTMLFRENESLRTFVGFLWMVAVISVEGRDRDIERLIEYVFLVIILTSLVVHYRSFLTDLLKFTIYYPILFSLLGLIYALVFCWIDGGKGVRNLFWSDHAGTLVATSFGVTMVLASIGNLAFLLDRYPVRKADKISNFLNLTAIRKSHPQRLDYSKNVRTIYECTIARFFSQLQSGDRDAFSLRLIQFLRCVRFPFLTILVLPALLPFVFTSLPRTRAIGIPFVESFGDYDVLTWQGYIIRLLLWVSGIFLGVLFYRSLVSVSSFIGIFISAVIGKLEFWIERKLTNTTTRTWLFLILIALSIGLVAEYLYSASISLTLFVVAVGIVVFMGDRIWRKFSSIFEKAFTSGILNWWIAEKSDDQVSPIQGCGFQSGVGCPARGCPASSPEVQNNPSECLEIEISKYSIWVLLITFVMFYFVCSQILYVIFPASVAICMLLAVIAISTTMLLNFNTRKRYLYISLFIMYIALANHDPLKDRFPGMSPYYSASASSKVKEIELKETVDNIYFPERLGRKEPIFGKRLREPLIENESSLGQWKSYASEIQSKDVSRPKLVVISVSGGAIRSAYWASVVLDTIRKQLDESSKDTFDRSVRVITGASGGMIGMSCYVEQIYRKRKCPNDQSPTSLVDILVQNDMIDGLTEPSRYIALKDIFRTMTPRIRYPDPALSFDYDEFDRGSILEKQWKYLGGSKKHSYYESDRELPNRRFVDYAPLEREGKLPSLIFSPMIVDDGRFLFISNLDLRSARPTGERASAGNGFRSISLPEGSKISEKFAGGTIDPYSILGYEFFKLFPEAVDFRVATAARMSASFPFFSPAVALPTIPPRRVVDAGYYDSKGVHVGTAWISMNREWLQANTSGVLLVQIRDDMSLTDRWYINERPLSITEQFMTGFGLILSPIEGASRARSSTAMFRNDRDIQDLSNWFTKSTGLQDFFTTAVFENPAGVSRTRANKTALEPGEELLGLLGFKQQPAKEGNKPMANQDPITTETDTSIKDLANTGSPKLDPAKLKMLLKKIEGAPEAISMNWNLSLAERNAMDAVFDTKYALKDRPEIMKKLEQFIHVDAARPTHEEQEKVKEKPQEDKPFKSRLSYKDLYELRSLATMELVKIRNRARLDKLVSWWKTDHNPALIEPEL